MRDDRVGRRGDGPAELGRRGDGPAELGRRRRGDGPAGKVLVSGSAGFIGGYVVGELLDRGYEVVGLDNFSKYGKVAKSYDSHPGYRLVEGDARDVALLTGLLADCDHFIAGAAMIGGISYFHAYAYDLLATNERIIAASATRPSRPTPRAACARSPTCPRPWCSRAPASGRPMRASSGRSRRRSLPTASRSSPSSTSPRPHGTSTGCRSPSSGRSTAWGSARAGRWATSRSCRGTSGWQ